MEAASSFSQGSWTGEAGTARSAAKGDVSQHIDSFNYFIQYGIAEIVAANNKVCAVVVRTLTRHRL